MQMLVALAAALILLTGIAEAKVQTKTIEYEQGGTALEGYLAWDDADGGPRPGVLVVHQWMGLTDYEKKRAEMIAELGYVAFACDLFGKDVHPANGEEAAATATKYRGDLPLFRARLQAGLDTLRAQDGVDTARIAAVGYCFGGGGVLELARSGADIAGVVSFHGSLATTLPAQAGAVKAKVLACHGADDPYVPPDQVAKFEDEMRAAGVDWQLISYGGTVHSFTDWNANTPGQTMYNASSDKRSWQAMRGFFAEIFGE